MLLLMPQEIDVKEVGRAFNYQKSFDFDIAFPSKSDKILLITGRSFPYFYT